IDTNNLKEENSYLKHNLQENVVKLNKAFKAIDIMQQLIIGIRQLHESYRINFRILNKPKDFINTSNEEFSSNPSLF
ncbi:2748_t:CDS:1, partial [Funneliformis geosporum]